MGDVNEIGKVYKCDPGSRRCQEIPIQRPPDAVNMSLGLSLAARGSNLLVCGPTMHRACGENMYVNGYGFLLRPEPPAAPAHPGHSGRRELFTSGRGARDKATNVLIVITDGQKYKDPLSYSDAIPEAERAGIVRYAIGEITSEPTDEHVFRVDNFDALQGIQNQLQAKIFAIEEMPLMPFSSTGPRTGDWLAQGVEEWDTGPFLKGVLGPIQPRGTQSQSGSSFQLEMSQEGFSSLLSPVSDAWPQGVSHADVRWGPDGSSSLSSIRLDYSSQIITADGQSSYVVGAPRYQHAGKVVLFSRDTNGGEWTPRWELQGEQVGSYFGGTLCAVDLDRDGNTDLVLIGAPTYYTPLNGGRVYICSFSRQGLTLRCRRTLQGQRGQPFGRFGASMSEIGDISGDGWRDVAIGAPTENDNNGALYIFHGEKRGLRPQYRQGPCHGQGQEQLNTEASRANICFTVTKGTMDSLGDRISSTIQYSLALDPRRMKIRAAFVSNGPILSGELQLSTETRCETYQITLPLCPEDTLTPITLRLNYTVTGELIAVVHRLRPILSEDSTVMTSGLKILMGGGGYSGVGDSVVGGCCGDNGGPITERMIHRAELPVKYGIFLILTSLEESTKYVNFSAEEAGTSVPVTHGYEVKNLRQRSVPISVTFQFPVELSGVRVWDASEVVPSKPQLAQCVGEAEIPGSKDFVEKMSEHPLLDCSVAICKKIRCSITSLEMQQPLEFMIKGNVQTVVERSEAYNYLPIIMDSSVGGLVLLALITAALYKLNFFKRQYKKMMEDARDGAGARLDQSNSANVCLSPNLPK
ncbi:Integrin alpha-D [Chelonia mydas]|uniref:Integrin alpha-D n=1 Tax=Chelonia mydas TaxID=8469 RepID=M7AMD1_CHEMY|nr:Integrin alpha-D [Chelonia mydas]